MKVRYPILATVSLAICSFAVAQPSEYYLWKHKDTGKTVCEVTAPDVNWTRAAGPFEDPNCKSKRPQ